MLPWALGPNMALLTWAMGMSQRAGTLVRAGPIGGGMEKESGRGERESMDLKP